MEKVTVNREYKDVLFRFIFKEKKRLLELYNAVNGTHYEDESQLEIVTLEDVIYMNVKNDVAFVVGSQIHLYEHQSTWNPNMPIRCLIYIAKEYDKLIIKKSLYSRKLQKIPTPRFVVFYNGEAKCILRPSAAAIPFLSGRFTEKNGRFVTIDYHLL